MNSNPIVYYNIYIYKLKIKKLKGEEAQEQTSKHNIAINKNFSMRNCSIDHFPGANYHHALK